jgi:hypothetical protein
MVILTKTKVLKTQRDSKSELRKSNSKSVLKFIQPVKPVNPAPKQVWSTRLTLGQVNPAPKQVWSTRLVRSLYRILETFTGLVQS